MNKNSESGARVC